MASNASCESELVFVFCANCIGASYSLGTTSFFCLNSPCIVVATPPLRSGNFCESLEVSRSLGSQRTSNTTNDQRDFDPKNAMLLRLIIINKPNPNPNLGGSAPQTPRDFGKWPGRCMMSF